MSPSLRGRGLKFLLISAEQVAVYVALFTRAWIEIAFATAPANPAGGRPLYEGVD